MVTDHGMKCRGQRRGLCPSRSRRAAPWTFTAPPPPPPRRFSRVCGTRVALVRKRARGALQVFGEFGCNGIWPKRPCRIRRLSDEMAASWRRVAKAQGCGGTRVAQRRRILFGEVVRAQSSVPKYGSTATPRSHGSVSTTAPGRVERSSLRTGGRGGASKKIHSDLAGALPVKGPD
jgi:hypothetical protein